MTTDPIAAARVLIEPLTGHTEGPWWTDGEYCDVEFGIAVIAARTDCGPLPGNPTRGMVAWASQLHPENAPTCEADARLIAAAPELRDMVATLADALETERAENQRLREALKMISAPQYGLQALIEDGASEEEITQYWANLASSFATTARIALRNPTAATPDTDAKATLRSTEAGHDT